MQWKMGWRTGASRASLLVAALALGVLTGLEGQAAEPPAVQTTDAISGRELDGWQKVRIRIRNDLVPTRSVIVSVVTPTRPQLVLGILRSNETREWEIDSRSFAGGLRLVAEGNPRDIQVSRGISVVGDALVRWSLGTGLVRVERREAADPEPTDAAAADAVTAFAGRGTEGG